MRVLVAGAGLMGSQIGCEYALGGHDVVLQARDLAAAAPDALVATNTSSLSITAIGDAIGAPERTVGVHYWNPPLFMPLVEIVAGERTSPETIAFARDAVAALGKRPVLVERDV